MESQMTLIEGSSFEDLRAKAAKHFGVSEDQIDVKVVDEEKSFFGLFGRKLRAECRVVPPVPAKAVCDITKKIVSSMGFELTVQDCDDRQINLTGADAALLLEDGGAVLKSLDYLVNLMHRNEGPCPRVSFDSDGYRVKREAELEQMAVDGAKEAMSSKRTVYLPPMESWERRLVHLALKDSVVVETHSLGLDPHRRVAIRMKGQGRGDWSDEENRLNRRFNRYRGSHRDGDGSRKEFRDRRENSRRDNKSDNRRRYNRNNNRRRNNNQD